MLGPPLPCRGLGVSDFVTARDAGKPEGLSTTRVKGRTPHVQAVEIVNFSHSRVGSTRFRSGCPARKRSRLSVNRSSARSRCRGDVPAARGVRITFGSVQSALSAGSGSSTTMSSPAPAIAPRRNASIRAGSSTTDPRATFPDWTEAEDRDPASSEVADRGPGRGPDGRTIPPAFALEPARDVKVPAEAEHQCQPVLRDGRHRDAALDDRGCKVALDGERLPVVGGREYRVRKTVTEGGERRLGDADAHIAAEVEGEDDPQLSGRRRRCPSSP
jgi:hypothetical protein